MKLSPIFFLILVSAIDQASAATINYTQDRRSAVGIFYDGFTFDSIAGYPSAPYVDMTVYGQTSSLGTNGFSVTGAGFTTSTRNRWSDLVSVFDISFSVANGTTMALSGMLEGRDISYGYGNASIFLYKGDNRLTANQLYGSSVSAHGGYGSVGISYRTLLSAGEYRLVATANPGLQGTSSLFNIAESNFNFNASLTVPVPAAAWLFGSGLLGLIAVSAKRRHY